MTRTVPAIACLVALLSACSDGRGTGGERVAGVALSASRINAGATGRAFFSALGERTQVSVIVSGWPPEIAPRPVHLYTYLAGDARACARSRIRRFRRYPTSAAVKCRRGGKPSSRANR